MENNFSIDNVCVELGITRQMLNVKCRKLGIVKKKVGRRSYITAQQLKKLKGKKITSKPIREDTERSGISSGNDERLIKKLEDEVEYLKKKLDEEGEKVKGSINVVFEQQRVISSLRDENQKLLPFAPPKKKKEGRWQDKMNEMDELKDELEELKNKPSFLGRLFGKKRVETKKKYDVDANGLPLNKKYNDEEE